MLLVHWWLHFSPCSTNRIVLIACQFEWKELEKKQQNQLKFTILFLTLEFIWNHNIIAAKLSKMIAMKRENCGVSCFRAQIQLYGNHAKRRTPPMSGGFAQKSKANFGLLHTRKETERVKEQTNKPKIKLSGRQNEYAWFTLYFVERKKKSLKCACFLQILREEKTFECNLRVKSKLLNDYVQPRQMITHYNILTYTPWMIKK